VINGSSRPGDAEGDPLAIAIVRREQAALARMPDALAHAALRSSRAETVQCYRTGRAPLLARRRAGAFDSRRHVTGVLDVRISRVSSTTWLLTDTAW